jgi:hypothetical protein
MPILRASVTPARALSGNRIVASGQRSRLLRNHLTGQTIIVLLTIATCLLWTWFRGTDKESAAAVPAEEATLAAAAVASESPSLLERAWS